MAAAGDLAALSLVDAAEAIRDGSVTSSALTEIAIDRLETIGRELNCTISVERESALEAAAMLDRERKNGRLRGPLHGVPLAHKDLFYRAGKTVTCGSEIRRDFVPTTTATVLTRLEQAGAVTIGALHLAEFAFSPTGFNKHFGSCRNPWNRDHVTGGSSSGSGAAVAARLVYGSLGTDSGGSIRHPAAMCGVTGVKPTQTRVSRAGVMPLSFSLDCVGPLTRTARDGARLLTIIAGQDAADSTASSVSVPDYETALSGDIRGLRIAVPDDYYYDLVTDEIRTRLAESISAFEELGAKIIKRPVPNIGLINALAQLVMVVEAATIHQEWLRSRRDDYAEVVRNRIEPGLLVPATRYCEALAMRGRIVEEFIATVFGDADIVHLPAISIPVPTIAETTEGDPAEIGKRLGALTHCTRGINYLGLPVASVPAGFTSNGLPCGFQLLGRPFAESVLLKAAHAYQSVTDWQSRSPALAENEVTSAPRHGDSEVVLPARY
jgi:aspartyl-tRNA(Asn)/glutamyl-tRNA(Gln) amidotransferase subunit A